jgi:hypothetical protein
VPEREPGGEGIREKQYRYGREDIFSWRFEYKTNKDIPGACPYS